MTVQVLVATMNQKDYSLLDKMNIQTDAIVCNQCDKNEIVEFDYKGHNIKWYSFAERGVGLNRNNALMRATADICVFADDDMVFVDGYEKILKTVTSEKKADVYIFNLIEEKIVRHINKKYCNITKTNYGKYGAARIVIRRESIFLKGITFSLLFGGGAKYSAGEDTLFLRDCLNDKLKIIATPYALAELKDDRPSTWFKGFDDKYFFDKGVLFSCLSKHNAKLLSFYHCFKFRKKYKEYGVINAYRMMKKGIKVVKGKI